MISMPLCADSAEMQKGRTRGADPALLQQIRSVLVGTEVEVVQGDGLAGPGVAELVVVGVVAGDGVRRGAGLLGRLHPDVPVALQAGAGRDELADDHVLLQTTQAV